jgi:hypothetical protein
VAPHGRKYGEKESRPIPVWNGVLEHCRRIAFAIWVFLWCLDKITEERDGIGVVLGGSPVKIAQIAADLELGEHTVRRQCECLERENYIRRRRTPYGFVIEVLNSRKFNIWHTRENVKNGQSLPCESVQKRPVSPSNVADLTVKNGRNKEDAAVDAAKDAAVRAAAAYDSLNAWQILGSDLPMGSPKFQKIFEHYFATRNGNPLSDAMERAIQAANKRHVSVPPKFFEAKRIVERREAEELAAPAMCAIPELEAEPWAR